MTSATTSYEHFLSDHRALNGANGSGPAWLRTLRNRSLETFSEIGLPTARRGNERWKYTNVAPIARTAFRYAATAGDPDPDEVRRAVPWHQDWLNLVFVDGHYSESLSTVRGPGDGVQVRSLAEAVASNGQVVEEHLSSLASVEDDGFTALNTAFVQDGAFIQIAEGRTLESPLHLVFASTAGAEPTVSYPRVLVVAGAASKATVVESYVGLGGGRYFTDSVAEMVIGPGAEVDHYRLLSESEAAYHVGVARVRLEEDSVFSSHAFSRGTGFGRYDLNVTLDGSGASCSLKGLYVTSGAEHMDNLIEIDHRKPRSSSRLYYKGILDGKSRAVFGGTVWVRQEAQKTDALQSDKNLVLSPDAEVDSKPALFIYADDVKCGHGATAGNIDLDTVFYMRSRGMDLDTASQLLIHGFASEIVDDVRVDGVRSYLQSQFLESLPVYRFEF